MSEHDRYEELAALAAGGLLSGSELKEWIEHSSGCPHCRNAYRAYGDIHDQDLPLAAMRRWDSAGSMVPPPSDFRENFLVGLQEAGWRFSDDAMAGKKNRFFHLPDSQGWQKFVPLIALTACVLIIALFLGERHFHVSDSVQDQSHSYGSETSGKLRSLAEENVRLLARLQELKNSDAAKNQRIAALETNITGNEALLHELRSKWQESREEKSELEQALQRYSAESESHLQETKQQLQQAQVELERARNSSVQNEASMVALQTRVTELDQQLRMEVTSRSKDRELLSADRDIRDIMGARKLHIVDVIDADVSGKKTRAFGRVFYTEGKSLVFYAFDLSENRIRNANYSFQVWGENGMSGGLVKSLGLLYKDDNAQRRWVLEVNDPEVLHQINKVFVTVEPYGGGNKPRGQKLLYAFLGMDANHP